LRLLVAATTSAVVLAFLIPMLLLVRQLASDRASAAAFQEAQQIAVTVAAVGESAGLAAAVEGLVGGSARRVSVVLPDGSVVGRPIDDDPDLDRALAGESFRLGVGEAVHQYVPAVSADGTFVVRTVIPESELRRGVTRASLTISGLGLLLLMAALITADRLARSVSQPFHELARAADQMREGRLDLRVSEEGLPEAVAVGKALNRLAGRVEELLAAERDSVADLSHRLRTPVTALRLDAESLTDPEAAERLRVHVGHLERSIDAIVKDARRPVRASVAASCDAAAVVRDRVAFWSALAEDQNRALLVGVGEGALEAGIDAGDLADVVDVLIDNVFAHTPDGAPLSVALAPATDGRAGVILTIEDGGPGLPPGDVTARGASGAGSTGLGLDIARRAAIASGGRLELGTSLTLGGAQVRLVLGAVRS
jgi:signal transduction histidine kinase